VNRRDRIRRVVLLCAHFSRNLAYYRAGHNRLTDASPSFWITTDNNFLDIAVLEWCKLFGDRNGNHFWAKVVADPPCFKTKLLHQLGINADGFTDYVNQMRAYRDKFLAHLNDLPIMNIPFLDRARDAVDFYHRYIVGCEIGAIDLAGLPTNLDNYFKHCFAEARAIYDAVFPEDIT
jgi:hypothetical protein